MCERAFIICLIFWALICLGGGIFVFSNWSNNPFGLIGSGLLIFMSFFYAALTYICVRALKGDKDKTK